MLIARIVIVLLLQTTTSVLCGVCLIPEPVGRKTRLNRRSSVDPQHGRIVGGYPISITEAPYQISLHDRGFFCAGVLISDQWALTAAHCTATRDKKAIRARVGSSLYRSSGALINVVEVVQHDNFTFHLMDYDFALLKFEQPIDFDESKQPVKLPEKNQVFMDGEMCLVSGWGSTRIFSNGEPSLRQVEVPLVNQQECADSFMHVGTITETMVCAGYPTGGKDACTGDSGGALVTQDRVLVGLVSWGYDCARPKYPGVYARITNALDWIKDITNVSSQASK